MKPAFGRVRPCHVLSLNPRLPEGIQCSDTGSMASSHAANHFSIAVFMVLLYGLKRRSNMVFWFLWAFSIAYSRVYCGVHYPSDVIVGSLLGAFIGYLCFTLYSKTKDKVLWK